MADFVNDYSGIAAAGSAFEGFAKGFGDAQDKKMKRLETEAQMEALKAKMQREQDQSEMDRMNAGLKKDPLTGQLTEAPLTPRQRSANQLKAFGEGAKISGTDEQGNPTGYEYDPESAKAKQIDASKFRITSGQEYKQEAQQRMKDAVDRREHERVLVRINSNPNIRTRLQQFQNLDNTLSNIANADHITPEMFDEAQQAIRANLGIKGGSGVGERELTQMKSMGLNADRFAQFLTGKPSDVSKQNEFLKHIQNLARLEKQNISSQFAKSLGAASAGHKSMYDRRPDLFGDLQDAIQMQKEQLSPGVQEQAPAVPPPQGLVAPKQGLMGRISGLLGFGGAHAAQAPAAHPQDAVAVKWAQEQLIKNPNDPQALAVLKANGL